MATTTIEINPGILSLGNRLRDVVTDMHTSGITYDEAVSAFKKQYLERALEHDRFNQVQTAKKLGIHRNTLHRQIEELGVEARWRA